MARTLCGPPSRSVCFPFISFPVNHPFRHQQFRDVKARIDAYEGGLDKFSQGYKHFGFNRVKDAIVYREWAPHASRAFVFGDFSALFSLHFAADP